MSKPLYMEVTKTMPIARRPEIIKRDDRQKSDADRYIERHELSLLELLVQRHPERARRIIEKLLLQKRAA